MTDKNSLFSDSFIEKYSRSYGYEKNLRFEEKSVSRRTIFLGQSFRNTIELFDSGLF
jgi:extradiol dioxygenase family protein